MKQYTNAIILNYIINTIVIICFLILHGTTSRRERDCNIYVEIAFLIMGLFHF